MSTTPNGQRPVEPAPGLELAERNVRDGYVVVESQARAIIAELDCLRERKNNALLIIERFGGTDEMHHARWVIDQVARALLGDGYSVWVKEMTTGENEGYDWQEGIAP